jgi:serpin B
MTARPLLFVALTCALGACVAPSTDRPGVDPDRVARAITSPDGDIGVMVEGHNAFTFDLHAELIALAPTDNLFFSPFSITSALGMTRAGARGTTADELREALHAAGDDADWHAALGALTRDLNGDLGRGYTLQLANRLFGQQGFPFEADFLATCADDYGAPFETWDFRADPDGGRQHVNEWVADQTNDRIEDLLPEGSVDDGTRLILANAIYFLADWAVAFDPADTADGAFTTLDGGSATVPFMNRDFGDMEEHGVTSAYHDGVWTLSMPYQDDEVSMILLVPDAADGLPALEASLDAARWAELTSGLSRHDGPVRMPRLELRSEVDLVPVLQSLGVEDAFDSEVADFTGIAPPVDGNLFITGVFHQAFVRVDEAGTEAAAATGVVVGTESAPAAVIADRPFLFAIRDDLTGALLFLGRVTDPS